MRAKNIIAAVKLAIINGVFNLLGHVVPVKQYGVGWILDSRNTDANVMQCCTIY